MDYKQWVDLFGRTTEDKDMWDALAKAGVKRAPVIAKDELDARVELKEIMLIFTDQALFPELSDLGEGHGVLTAVILNLGTYPGPLPFKLKRSDSQSALRARFGEPIDEDEDFRWDEWEVGDLVLRVTYAADLGSLDESVTVKLPEPD